jgi:hypothetical protein
MAWYQGDIETNAHGRGHGRFIGRFNEETFIVAPGAVPAPSVHNNAFPDATLNPATGPIHTYHLGLWFNSPQDAVKAGCPGGVTPFNGEHNAGIQVLNTSNFPNPGPLPKVKPIDTSGSRLAHERDREANRTQFRSSTRAFALGPDLFGGCWTATLPSERPAIAARPVGAGQGLCAGAGRGRATGR